MEKNYKILVVDDSIQSLKLICEILLFNGYNIIKTTSGKKAITLAVKHEPDLIILDIMMPYINGHQILAKIKSFDFLKNKPVIMLTASSSLEDIKILKQAGITSYVLKPISVNAFIKRIRKILPLKNYNNMGAYYNGDNYVDERDKDDDMTEVEKVCKILIQKKKSLGRVDEVMKKETKQETKITVIDGYPVRQMNKKELKSGMTPGLDIETKSGIVIHPAGIELNEKVIKKIQNIDIEEKKLFIRG